MSNAIALVVGHTQCRHTWFEQHKIVEEMKGFGRLELLDEETLRAMVRSAVQEGSPGDDTSCIAVKRRAFEDTGLSKVLLVVDSGLNKQHQ